MSNLYCTTDDMDRYLSVTGVAAYLDNDADGVVDDNLADDCIDQASAEIDMAVLRRYVEADVASDRNLNRWATVMACRFACLRRGNAPPESLEIEFQRITDPESGFLSRLKDGRDMLPGVPLRNRNVPAFANLTVDRRYTREQVRVTMANSNGDPTVLERDTAREIVIDG